MSIAFVPSSPGLPHLLELVEQAVHIKTGGRIRGLSVRVNDGRLIVSGKTSSYYNKQLVTCAVQRAVEDMSVTNDVEVC
ncbi:hypothetical protein [Schlesneria paludicola]|uniref:hypothetical protein n=1 Tax=Schlesneria paludicola TaxID=360056 RepID=UPI00029A4824|nr:hypothetical protein [Schlesneria paludicola]